MNMLKNNKELLYKLYIDEQRSLSSIAKDYSVSSMTIRAWLHKVGIKTRVSTVNIYKELKTTAFSDTQKHLLVGSLLGDGSLSKGKDSINARFTERHCEKQLSYLQWKNNKLKPFVKSKLRKDVGGKHIISGVECNTQNSFMLTTITHPYLTELHTLFYLDGKKTIPNSITELISALSIMTWICDDGCLTYCKKSGTYKLDLHTESFTYKENLFLCRDVLSNFFNLSFRINSRRYSSGKAYYICISGKRQLRYIVNILKPFIPECMLYKFKHYL